MTHWQHFGVILTQIAYFELLKIICNHRQYIAHNLLEKLISQSLINIYQMFIKPIQQANECFCNVSLLNQKGLVVLLVIGNVKQSVQLI